MTDQNDDEQLFMRARGFGKRMGFGKRPAILVVDLVNAFTDPERMLGAELSTQVEATNALLDAAHAKDVPVISQPSFMTIRSCVIPASGC